MKSSDRERQQDFFKVTDFMLEDSDAMNKNDTEEIKMLVMVTAAFSGVVRGMTPEQKLEGEVGLARQNKQ